MAATVVMSAVLTAASAPSCPTPRCAFAFSGHLIGGHQLPSSRKLCSERERRAASFLSSTRRFQPSAALDAILFDCDGVLAETERDAHRVAFNLAFDEKNLDTHWDEGLYGKLLETGGGKERMTVYWNKRGWPAGYEDMLARVDLVKSLHIRKTELFMDIVEAGTVPLREGVKRLVEEAFAANVPVAVCSTSNERAVEKIVAQLGPKRAEEIQIFAGDVVPRKKPSPDIYLLAAEKLGLNPANVCVMEDTHIGLKAAKAAQMRCIVTKSIYTEHEDFTGADRVVASLEKPRITLDDLIAITENNEQSFVFSG